MVPAILPPPAPFKLFVLMAGVAEVRPLTFVTVNRGRARLRYLVLGALAVWYGDCGARVDANARPDCRRSGSAVIIVAAAVGWWLLQAIDPCSILKSPSSFLFATRRRTSCRCTTS